MGPVKDREIHPSSRLFVCNFLRQQQAMNCAAVREILVSSPGRRPVQLLFDRGDGHALRLDAGVELRVNLTQRFGRKAFALAGHEEIVAAFGVASNVPPSVKITRHACHAERSKAPHPRRLDHAGNQEFFICLCEVPRSARDDAGKT